MNVYAIDIGGSSIKHGLVDTKPGDIHIINRGVNVKLKTNNYSEIERSVLTIVGNAVKENPALSAVGICTTGSVDTEGIVVSAGHFDGYTDISWKNIITNRYRQISLVTTTNDGRASAWGEYSSYENENKSHLHVVVGTGVGGGIVYNSELLMGDSGQAGYIGHMKITDRETIKCSCGKTGCVETLASSRGIVDHYKSELNSDLQLEFSSIVELALTGEVSAINAISKGAYWLGIGIGNAMNILNPSVVTIGGGVPDSTSALRAMDDKNVYFNSVLQGIEYASHKRVYASCDIRIAHFGNDAGLIGAASITSHAAHKVITR